MVIRFLESAFKKDPRVHPDHGGASSTRNEENHIYDENNHETDKAVREAYDFMELTPPCALEEIKKKYKKLSLRYHPDRGGSNEMMAKLNACLAIVEKDIKVENSQDQDDVEEEEEFDYDQMRKDMEAAMEEEMERHRQKRKDFNRHKQADKGTCHRKQRDMGLYSEEGRREAHEDFCSQMKEKQTKSSKEKSGAETKKDTPKPSEGSVENDSTANNSKPHNFVMDYNADDIVAALRLGMPDIALELIEEKINKFIQQKAFNARMSGQQVTINELGIAFLIQPLDFDDNALLHYAIYYETYQVINAICGIAQKFNGLETILYQQNKYGQTPSTFAEIAQDESIRRLVQAQIDLVQNVRSKTKIFPAIKAAVLWFGGIVMNIDLLATFCTILSFYLGHNIFNTHKITTLVGVVFMQFGRIIATGDEQDARNEAQQGISDVALLLSFFATWIFLRSAVLFLLQYIMIELCLIMAPFTIAAFVHSRRGSLVDRVLLPLSLQAYVARYLDTFFSRFYELIMPQAAKQRGRLAKQRGRLAKPFFFILVTAVALATKHLVWGANS